MKTHPCALLYYNVTFSLSIFLDVNRDGKEHARGRQFFRFYTILNAGFFLYYLND